MAETEGTLSDIACPYCGAELSDMWEVIESESDQGKTFTCGHCDNKCYVSFVGMVTYVTLSTIEKEEVDE